MTKVIARKGIQVPLEGHPDRYITDDEAVDVPWTPYWHRRLRDGDLLLYTEPEPSPVNDAGEATEAKLAEKTAEKPVDKAAKANK
jgi:hypothetical protein